MHALRFIRQRSAAKVIASDAYRLLATFLETDVQDEATAAAMLRQLTAAGDAATGCSISGNAHTVEVGGDGTIIVTSLFDEEARPLTMPAERFIAALSAWNTFLGETGLLALAPKF